MRLEHDGIYLVRFLSRVLEGVFSHEVFPPLQRKCED